MATARFDPAGSQLPTLLHTVSSLKSSSGGTSRSVPALCEALGSLGLDVSLLSQSARWPTSTDCVPERRLVRTDLVWGINIPALRASYSAGFRKKLQSVCAERRVDLIHTHGVWAHVNHATANVSRTMRIPMVVSPRGMLEEWALAYRGWKKSVAWRLYQATDLQGARAFCASSLQEANQIRSLGFVQPIAVIPNGVDLPVRMDRKLSPDRQHTALFLSRIHPKKGVLDLVQAWAAVRPYGWRLVIAGPDEGGHAKEVSAAIRRASLEGAIELLGEVGGEKKEQLWRDADLFVLPTRSENFGIVVAEALAWGIPVITTRGAPWSDLVEWNCGWWTDPGARGLGDALTAAVALTEEGRAEMAENGRRLVSEKYVWSTIAENTLTFYKWLLYGGEKPDHVLSGS